MITSFRHSEDIDKHIIKTPLDHTASWINVVEPDREEIENLMEQYNIPEDFIRDPLDSEESSRIEYDEDTGYSLIIIDLPIVNSTNRSVLSFVTIPLGIIIGNGIIVTVCDAENEFLENLPKRDINLKSLFCKMLSITKCYSQSMILMKQLHYYFMERRVSLC